MSEWRLAWIHELRVRRASEGIRRRHVRPNVGGFRAPMRLFGPLNRPACRRERDRAEGGLDQAAIPLGMAGELSNSADTPRAEVFHQPRS